MKANTLEELVEYLSERFDVSYAKLARIAVKVSKWQKEQMIRDCSVQASYEAEIEKAEERGYNLCKEQMLQLAKNRYEVVMAFGTGNPDVDHALQMDRLALVKIIEESKK